MEPALEPQEPELDIPFEEFDETEAVQRSIDGRPSVAYGLLAFALVILTFWMVRTGGTLASSQRDSAVNEVKTLEQQMVELLNKQSTMDDNLKNLEKERDDWKSSVQLQTSQNELLSKELEQTKKALVEAKSAKKFDPRDSGAAVRKAEAEAEALKSQLINTNQKQKALLDVKDSELDQLKKTQAKMQSEIDLLRSKVGTKALPAKTVAAAPVGPVFAGIIINWATKDHAIDLTVTDPEGMVFTFKKKIYPNHPGKFTLDTRRGPGAEMWTTETVIPGVYIVKYSFYNSYGNPQLPVVDGVIYTNKGTVHFPKVELDEKNRERVFKVNISKDGDVNIN